MKIAIITLIGTFNNGNRLQNYALQQTLKSIYPNATIETINLKEELSIKARIKNVLRFFFKPQPQRSKKQFNNFNKNISFSQKKYDLRKDKYKKLVDKYDYFVTGSDQVWNMGYYSNELYYFLDFVPSEKKLSYAASIGNNKLSPFIQAKFINLLKSYRAISVREYESEIMLNQLGFTNVETHIDPTLMLTDNDWNKIIQKPQGLDLTGNYIFVCMIDQLTDVYKQKINLLAQMFDLKIITLNINKQHIGPSEFVYLIKNAKFVITDSFHCIVFSIIYDTTFFHFSRVVKDLSNPSLNINSRLQNLERIFHTTFLTDKDIDSDTKEKISLFKIENKDIVLQDERKKSIEYLKRIFHIKKAQNLNAKIFNCTGCGLCANICPQKAISIIKNSKGFYQYSIDESKCNKCGACTKLCPANSLLNTQNYKNSLVLGAKNKKQISDSSSSAGIFGKIATTILKDNGIVYGLSYNSKNTFSRVTKFEELETIKGSKYYQANISTIYAQLQKDLEAKKLVLVCGTPCQIAGLNKKFGKYQNFLKISVVCHGTPSKDVLEEFCKQEYKDIPTTINFRKKNPYWENYSLEFNFENGRSIVENMNKNLWFIGFLQNYYLNNCCYECNFAGKDFGADIILGDFWGIDKIDKKFYDKYGTSLVICNTEKGKELINKIQNEIITKKYSNFNKITYYNPCILKTKYPKQKQYDQELFYLNRKNGIDFKTNLSLIKTTIKKPSFFKRALKKIKRIIFHK